MTVDELGPGEIGFITASIKEVADTRVGDTITEDKRPCAEPLPGFKPAQPVVFCGLFPVDAADFEDLRAAMGKLRLNDASFSYEMETSAALGFGFRCGFLGLLHLEIIQERLEREFDLDLIATAPSSSTKMHLTDGSMIELHNPADMPDVVKIDHRGAVDPRDDPDARRYLGAVLKLCQDRRGVQIDLLCRQARHGGLRPAAERGGVRFLRPAEVDLEGLCLLRLPDHGLPRGRPRQDVDPGQRRAGGRALHAGAPHRAERRGRAMCEKLKDLIPPHMFKIPIQAAIGGKVIARETIRAAQGRDRQVLRRRHHPQAQAAGEAEGGQEAHAPVRQGRDPAGSLHPAGGLHRGAEDGGCASFPTTEGRMNLSLADTGGAALVVSQFTLAAETKGNRPGFSRRRARRGRAPLRAFRRNARRKRHPGRNRHFRRHDEGRAGQ
jgi:hypothetical protein